jgi:hypothetical protein
MENLLEYSARRNELDWAVRNKAKLTPEQRAKYRAMWEEMNSSTPPSSSTAEVSFGPADLDPVEAAAAPIAPDPVVAPKRPAMPKPSLTDTLESANTLASLDNFDAAFQSNGNHYPTAVAAFAQQLVARGVDPAYAQRAARARAEEHRSPYSRDVYADEMAATENPNELYAGYRNAPDSSPPGFSAGVAVLPDADPRTTRAERLAQSDRYAADVDRRAAEYNRDTGMPPPGGLAGADGSRDWSGWQPGDALPERPRMGPTALESARESQAADRNDAIGQKYGPIAQRIAEAGDAAGVTDYDAVKSPQERQMNTYQRAIEREARFGTDTESRDRARETLATLDKSRAGDNIAFRKKVANAPGAQARRDKEQSRLERWQAISMLAGGNPSRQQFAMGNAFLNMPSDWQNAVSAKALRPDMDGTTPLTVDANSAKNAMRLLNAEMIGQGGLGDTRAKMMEAQERDKAFAFAEREARKLGLMGYWKPSMTRQEAERLRRRVDAMHPGMGGVVDALPITEEGESPAAGPSIPAPPTGASGAPVPPMPSGRPGPPRPGSGSRYPNT